MRLFLSISGPLSPTGAPPSTMHFMRLRSTWETAPDRRRAVILISDNEPSNEETRDVAQVVRAAQQSGTPIYSVKVGFLQHSRTFFLTHPETRLHDVEKICRQTGGEMIDTRNGTSVTSAMETILTWLKQGYTLGY